MPGKSLEDIFENKYPNLPRQLKKVGITTLSLINQKVFNENEMYFFEVLGYDIEDNERIKNILREENTEDVLESFIVSSVESRFGSDAFKAILFLSVMVILIAGLIIFFIDLI